MLSFSVDLDDEVQCQRFKSESTTKSEEMPAKRTHQYRKLVSVTSKENDEESNMRKGPFNFSYRANGRDGRIMLRMTFHGIPYSLCQRTYFHFVWPQLMMFYLHHQT